MVKKIINEGCYQLCFYSSVIFSMLVTCLIYNRHNSLFSKKKDTFNTFSSVSVEIEVDFYEM